MIFEGVVQPACWMNVASTTNVPRLTRLMDHYWNMPKPEVIITVTGGAQDFQLSRQQQVIFDRGLVSAAQSAKAWIFTSGSDTGVMRLVGNAVAEYNVDLPVVGVFPWGVVNEREQLTHPSSGSLHDPARPGVATYKPTPPTIDGAPLNPNHTHFVFVDDGKEGRAAWGSEIQLRSALESAVSKAKNIPIVQLVVQGGPGTLRTVEYTALAGNPIVVLADTGGAATALHAYCTGGIDAVEPRFRNLEARLQSIKRLNDCFGGKQLLFFSLEDSSGPHDSSGAHDLSSSLLEAIMQMLNAPSAYERLSEGTVVNHPKRGPGTIEDTLPDLRRAVRFDKDGELHRYRPESLYKLLDTLEADTSGAKMDEATKVANRQCLSRTLGLAIMWNRPELARKILAGIQEEEPGAMHEVCEALQRAIALHRHEIVKIFLGLAGMTMEHMNMGMLYSRSDETKFLSSNQQLQRRLRHLSFEMSDPTKAMDQHGLYQKALNRLFMSISPILRQELHAEVCTRPNDIFYWLIMQGDEAMARDVWPFCDNPVHVALLGAAICMKMSQVITQGQAAMKERAFRLQEWALGAIEEAPDEKQAHFVLERSIREDRVYTVLDIALSTGAKKILFQRHSISLIDRWWRGDFTGSEVSLPYVNYPLLALETVFPFASPVLWVWPKKQTTAAPKDAYGNTVFYDALALAFSISSEERRMAGCAREMAAAVARDAAAVHARKMGSPAQLSAVSTCTTAEPSNSASVTEPGPRRRTIRRFANILHSASHTDASAILVRGSSHFLREWFSRLRTFYTIPAVKFVWRIIFQSLLTALYVILIMNFKTPHQLDPRFSENPLDLIPISQNFEPVEASWILCEIGLWLDKRHQQVLRSRSTGANTGGKRVAYLSDVLFLFAVGVRIAMERPYAANDYQTTKDLYEVYQLLVSLKAFLVISLDWMPFLSEYQPLGVLYIIVCAMVGDVITWILLFAVFTSAYMVMFVGLQKARMYTSYVDNPESDIDDFFGRFNVSALTEEEIALNFNFNSASGGSWAPLWALFGSFDPRRYNWLVSALLWSYCLLSSVGLVNLLVAMFADTYNKISKEAENEYINLRCTRLFEFKDSILPLPPVLNLPIIFWDTVTGLYNTQQTVCFNRIMALFSMRTARKNTAKSSGLPSFQNAVPVLSRGPSGRCSPAPGTKQTAPSQHSLSKKRRRSLTSRLPTSVNLIGLMEGEPKKRRAPTLFDGKLLAQEYLKHAEAREKDTVHALARTLRSELQLGMKQREDEFLAMSTRVRGVEKHLESHLNAAEIREVDGFQDIRESLRAIKAQLSELARPGPTVEVVATAQPSSVQ